MFAKKTIERFLNIDNCGLIKNASGVGTNIENVCKNTYKIYLQIDNKKVVDAKFKAFGNPNFLVICDEITNLVKNKTVDEILNLEEEIKEVLSNYESSKLFSVTFFKLAIENAIKDYRKKENKKIKREENKF